MLHDHKFSIADDEAVHVLLIRCWAEGHGRDAGKNS
jgi:hypothetical protein